MSANAALLALLLGTSLLLLAPASASGPRRLAGKLLAAGAGLIAGLTLAEYLLGLDLRIDQLLVISGRAPASTERPALQTVAAVVLMAPALLTIDWRTARGWRPAELLALASGLIPLAVLLGYLFAVTALYGPVPRLPSEGMSIPSAVALLALSTGALTARAQVGVLSVLAAEDSGGIAARQLVAWLLALVPLVCAIALGARLGLYAAPLASAGIVLSGLVVGSSFVLLISRRLSQLDAKRREGEESRLRLASLVGSANDAVIGKTLEGVILDWNAAAERSYGYPAAEMVGQSVFRLVPADRVHELQGVLESVRRGEGARSFETVRRRKDGSTFPVQVTISPILDGAGRVRGASTISHDITERKRAEEALRQAGDTERRLRAELEELIDQMPDGVLLYDGRGRLKAMNQVAAGLSREEAGRADPFGNTTVVDLRDPDGAPVPVEKWPIVRALRDQEAVVREEWLVRRRAGDLLPVSISAAPVRDAAGSPSGTMMIVQDVSARKELERLREEWGAVVAHDLRQPVSTIALAAESLAKVHAGPPSERERRILERIKSASGRLNRMISDLLDVSRIESRQLAVECRPADLGGLIDATIDGLGSVLAEYQLRVVVAPEQLAWIDPDRIHQVLGNLLSNAAKYGRPGTEIRVEAVPRDDEVEVVVTNHGPGISPDQMALLFSRFSRTRAAREGGTPGLGLGLYIARGLVEAHGGRLWAESTPGETTRFHFTVPRAPRPAPFREEAGAHAPS